ncbi:MAG: hypothetical protein HKM28_01985, partial [Flavobacteriaceae bacterium]|nr:hypothetical protein [Flavobacteriaceae bacterium]
MKTFLYIYLSIFFWNTAFSQSDVIQFTTDDELPEGRITCIAQSQRGFIWVKTSTETTYFNGYEWTSLPTSEVPDPPIFNCASDLKAIDDSIRERLASYKISSYIVDDHGSTWVGTQENGIFYFPKKENDQSTDVVFEFIGFNNKIVRDFSNEIDVDHRYQTLSIAYSTLDFRSDRKPQYRYKIEGIHTDWILTKDPKVQFTSLPDRGTYVFKIQALQPGLDWSATRELNLNFLTPFYKTYVFIAIWVVLMILFLIAVIRWYFRRRLKVERLESKLKDLEGKALQSQMNPHFVF